MGNQREPAPAHAVDHARSPHLERHPQRCGKGLDDNLENIAAGFTVLGTLAVQQLETLRNELQKTDEPDWSDSLVDGIIHIALAGGAAAGAAVLAEKVVESSMSLTHKFFEKI